jgi:hypothetical protein
VPLVAGCIGVHKLSRDSRIVWGIVTLGAIPQLLNLFVSNVVLLTVLYNLYTPFEFFMLYLMFRNKFTYRWNLAIFKCSVCLYILLSAIAIAYTGVVHRFVNEWVCLNNLIFTGWTLLFITEQFWREDGTDFHAGAPFLWYISAYFLYSPCTLLVYSLWNRIHGQHGLLPDGLRLIHNVFNILMYVFFTIGLKLNYRAQAGKV